MRTRTYPGHLERRGNGFRITLCVAGEHRRFTVRTRDRREAEQFARVTQAELRAEADRRHAGLPGSVRVSQLVAQFEHEELQKLAPGTARTYQLTLMRVREFFSGPLDLDVGRVRPGHIERFLSWRSANRRRKGKSMPIQGALANRTLNKERTCLHTLFALAERFEYREGNPVARTRKRKADPRTPVILTDTEYGHLLLECADPMLYTYVVLLGEAGLRDESEALWLRWEDVDLEAGFIEVVSGRGGHRTKSGKGRHVPMTRRLKDALRTHMAAHRGQSGWVFAHSVTARRHLRGERIASLRRAVVGAARRAGIDTAWHPHDLRHRRVTTWLAQQKSAALVQEAMGHADLRTTMGYKHLVPGDLSVLVDEPESAHV